MEPIALLALLGGGLLAGIINSVAGGGSLITLPLLVFAGLPPTVANASNRVAVAVQGLTSVAGFAGWGLRSPRSRRDSETAGDREESHLPWKAVAVAAAPTVMGSVFGAFVATRVPDEIFRPIMAVVLIAMGTLIVLKPGMNSGEGGARPMSPGLALAFFLAGAYGGFIQAGVGFMLLAALVPGMGLDLVRANGVKVTLILILTLMALGIFVAAGQVDWQAGAVLAIGTGVGGYLGARLAIRVGAEWLRWVLLVLVLASAFEILGVRELIFA
ncbi:MAG: sulfite exporter TauE/SafE family protein [Myxococcota bacterium]